MIFRGDPYWSVNTTVKEGQWCFHFSSLLKKNCVDQKVVVTFYRSTIEASWYTVEQCGMHDALQQL